MNNDEKLITEAYTSIYEADPEATLIEWPLLEGRIADAFKLYGQNNTLLLKKFNDGDIKADKFLQTLIIGDINPDNVKKFLSYIGMSPRTYESGTSVKGKGHITKVGNGRLRSLLYMCSWTAKRTNPQCVAVYEKMHTKGKPEKVIKVAIAHKLLRQVFGVIKHQQPFSMQLA